MQHMGRNTPYSAVKNNAVMFKKTCTGNKVNITLFLWMIATGDDRCGCWSYICQCEADLEFDIKPWHFLSEWLRDHAAQAGEFLQKHTMARPDSAYLPWWDQCGTTGGGCCDLFRHRTHIQVRKQNNWRVTGQTLIQDFPAVGKKVENITNLLKR